MQHRSSWLLGPRTRRINLRTNSHELVTNLYNTNQRDNNALWKSHCEAEPLNRRWPELPEQHGRKRPPLESFCQAGVRHQGLNTEIEQSKWPRHRQEVRSVARRRMFLFRQVQFTHWPSALNACVIVFYVLWSISADIYPNSENKSIIIN